MVTVLPYWSSTATCTAGAIVPTSVLPGWVVHASCEAAPRRDGKRVEVAVPPRPEPLALWCSYSPAGSDTPDYSLTLKKDFGDACNLSRAGGVCGIDKMPMDAGVCKKHAETQGEQP